jgi:hypothetical protein
MLYDVMIAKNVYSIHCIGLFIRDKIEEEHFPFMKLWEKYVGQRKKKERNYGWFDIALLTLFTLVTIIFPIGIFWINGQTTQAVIFGLLLINGLAFVFLFMVKYILYFEESSTS